MHIERTAIDRFRNATAGILTFIETIPKEAYKFRPTEVEDAWTIQEHIVHLVDSEVNAYLRLKSIVAASGSAAFVLDENRWTQSIDARQQNVDLYVVLLQTLRDVELQFLESLDYERERDKFIVHPQEKHLDLIKWLSWYGPEHFGFHQKLMVRNLEEWRRSAAKK